MAVPQEMEKKKESFVGTDLLLEVSVNIFKELLFIYNASVLLQENV